MGEYTIKGFVKVINDRNFPRFLEKLEENALYRTELSDLVTRLQKMGPEEISDILRWLILENEDNADDNTFKEVTKFIVEIMSQSIANKTNPEMLFGEFKRKSIDYLLRTYLPKLIEEHKDRLDVAHFIFDTIAYIRKTKKYNDVVLNSVSEAFFAMRALNETTRRKLLWHKADLTQPIRREPSEEEVANAYLDYLRENPDLENSRKLEKGIPFKISRGALQKLWPDKSALVKHSYLVLTDPDSKKVFLAAMLRGTKSEEGIIGHGTFGKILRTNLMIGDKEYCVKVAADGAGAKKEYEIMKMLSKSRGEKLWLFSRSEEERAIEHNLTHNKNWLVFGIGGKSYIVQPVIPGKPVDEVIGTKEFSDLDRPGLLKFALALTLALKELHDLGITHNDLGMGNILVVHDTNTDEFNARVIDFGTAKVVDKFDEANFHRDLADLSHIFEKIGINAEELMSKITIEKNDLGSPLAALAKELEREILLPEPLAGRLH